MTHRYSRYSELGRLMMAVKIIAKLGSKCSNESIAAALMEHCSAQERGDAAFAGQVLVDAYETNRKAEAEAEPRCCECGDNILDKKISTRTAALILHVHYRTVERDAGVKETKLSRADARYCSAKCRQKAYRKRVTAKHASNHSERNGRDACDGYDDAKGELAGNAGAELIEKGRRDHEAHSSIARRGDVTLLVERRQPLPFAAGFGQPNVPADDFGHGLPRSL
jgi:hypothetical protein